VVGFRVSAEFFALRAANARDPKLKQRHAESAEFYRKLAEIASTFPPGYSWPQLAGSNHWFNRAEACRTMAEASRDPASREKLLELATMCERLAAKPPT